MEENKPTTDGRAIDTAAVKRAYQAEVLFHLSQQIQAIQSAQALCDFAVEVLSEMFATLQVVMFSYSLGKFYYKTSKGIDNSLKGSVLDVPKNVILKIRDAGDLILTDEIKEAEFIELIKKVQGQFNFTPVALVGIASEHDLDYAILIGQSLTLHTLEKEDIRSLVLFINSLKAAFGKIELIGRLQEEKNKLTSIIENSINGVIFTDTELNILVINKQAVKMFKCAECELAPGENIFKALQNFQSNMRIEELLLREDDIVFELYRQAEGVFYSVFSRKIKDESGKITGMIMIIRDVSQERYTENLKTVFMATISHKLRTPLTIMKEGVSLLEEGILGELSPKQKSIVNKVFLQTQYLSSLISSLLDFTKIQADIMSGGLHKMRHNLKQFFDDLLLAMKNVLESKKAAVILSIADESSSFYFDKDMLQKAIGNIIDNAVKFNKEGVAITISVSEGDKTAQIVISDNGVGIPSSLIGRLFTSFQQVDTDMTGQIKGMGLGLYMAKVVIDAHNGEIACESEAGKGTKFLIKLPII